MSKLTVRLFCPINHDEPFSSGYAIFHRWLPLSEDEWFTTVVEDLRIRVWFDEDCIGQLSDVSPDEIENYVNLKVDTICLDVEIPNVSEELTEFIYEERDRPKRSGDPPETEEYRRLLDQYEKLGERIHRGTTEVLNRILDFFRVFKGQHWLNKNELELDNSASFFNATQAQVQIDGEWVRWWSPSSLVTLKGAKSDKSRYLSEGDWADLKKHVKGDRKPPAVLEFLSRAEWLADQEENRSAIVEAICALETALNQFAKNPDKDRIARINKYDTFERVHSDGLSKHMDELGLGKTIEYLLPILIPNDENSDELIENCLDAYEVRNNVVHNRQRKFDGKDIHSHLRHVRKMCEKLWKLTDWDQQSKPDDA